MNACIVMHAFALLDRLAAIESSSYLGDRSGIGGRHLSTLQRRGRARLGPEGRHSLANAIRQYKLLPQFDIRSSLGYSVLRARS